MFFKFNFTFCLNVNSIYEPKQKMFYASTIFGKDLIINSTLMGFDLRWSRGHKVRGQGQGHKKISRPRPRTDPLEAKAKDQGHRRKCSPKKRRFSKIFFKRSQKKKVFKNFLSVNFHLRKIKKRSSQIFCRFLALSNKISTVQKIVPSSSR